MADQNEPAAVNLTKADVIVVGGGNAGFTAAHAAAVRGRKVVLLEKGTEDMAGGNSFYTAGATRIVHNGLDDLHGLVEPDERHSRTVVPPYSRRGIRRGPGKGHRGPQRPGTDGGPHCREPVHPSLAQQPGPEVPPDVRAPGLRTRRRVLPLLGRAARGNVGGGEGLIEDHARVAAELGIEVRYGHAAQSLIVENGRVAASSSTRLKGSCALRQNR